MKSYSQVKSNDRNRNSGIHGGKPNQSPMEIIREWMEVLDTAIANDDRVAIKSVLVDEVPEFCGQHQAISAAAQT